VARWRGGEVASWRAGEVARWQASESAFAQTRSSSCSRAGLSANRNKERKVAKRASVAQKSLKRVLVSRLQLPPCCFYSIIYRATIG